MARQLRRRGVLGAALLVLRCAAGRCAAVPAVEIGGGLVAVGREDAWWRRGTHMGTHRAQAQASAACSRGLGLAPLRFK